MALMSSKESHKMACYLASIAKAGMMIVVLAFTYDLRELSEALIAASERGVGVQVIADYRSTLGGSTRDQVQRLRALRAAGIGVLLASGISIQEEYAAENRAVRPGQGIQHSKVLRMDKYVIVGSANWTTSSKCNIETSALIQLEQEGIREFDRRVELILKRSTPLTDEIETEATRRRAASTRPQRDVRRPEKRSPSTPPRTLGQAP